MQLMLLTMYNSICRIYSISKVWHNTMKLLQLSVFWLVGALVNADCIDFSAYSWPPRIQLAQSGCRVSIISRPSSLPAGFNQWVAQNDTLFSIENKKLTAKISLDNSLLEFYQSGIKIVTVPPIHIVGACSSSSIDSSTPPKQCTDYTRHDCTLRTGTNPNDCSCYCGSLTPLPTNKPNCPEGSEGIVYESATYRLPIVKPCSDWTLQDCSLRVAGTVGCPCVCGVDRASESIIDEVLHWGFVLGASVNSAIGVVALAVLIHDLTTTSRSASSKNRQ